MERFSLSMVWAAVLCTVVSSNGFAQENPRTDVAPIYEEGLRAMGAKDFATACQKFAEVTQKYPEGIGAWLELGRCEQARGRLARAYEVFKAAEAAATSVQQTERAERAGAAARALEPRLSRWMIAVPTSARGLPGLVVRVDGVVVGPDKWDKPMAVDGGSHVVLAEALGKRSWQTTVVVKNESDSKTVVVGPFEDAVAPVSAVVIAPVPARVQAKPTRPLRTVGFVTGGVGLAALAAGSIAGGIAFSRHGDAIEGGHCVDGGCNAMGGKLEAESRTAGNVSTAMFVAGGVLVAAGGVMAFAIPTREKSSATLMVGPTGVVGRWVF